MCQYVADTLYRYHGCSYYRRHEKKRKTTTNSNDPCEYV